MICSDAQSRLGPFDENYFPDRIGVSTEGPRDRRGQFITDKLLAPFGLTAINTMIPRERAAIEGTWACDYVYKHGPDKEKQTDYIFISANSGE